MNRTLKILRDFHYTVQGSLNSFPLKAGTVLVAGRILNNGTSSLTYECEGVGEHLGRKIYVQPLCGAVQVQ